jgi:hypothetical protein
MDGEEHPDQPSEILAEEGDHKDQLEGEFDYQNEGELHEEADEEFSRGALDIDEVN